MLKGGVEIASEYVQPHLGGDLAFIQGVAKAVLAMHAQDENFIQKYTLGFTEFATAIQLREWHELERSSGVSRSVMEKIAAIYARSNHCIFTWSMGLTHHTHGVHTIQTLVGLALLRGMVGKPGAGLLPLRGHSNIQGTGSMGFTPALKHAIQEKLEQILGRNLPTRAGMDTMACMHAAGRGEIDAAVMLGGNLLASNPDTAFATDALNNIPFKCFFNPTLNMSHVHGVDQEVVIFPVRARDEEQQGTTQESMFNFVRLSDGGIDRFPQLRSEVDLICQLGEMLIAPPLFDFSIFRSHERIRQLIGDVVPGFAKLASIDASKQEFHIEGRTLHTPAFPTPDNKARFYAHPLPPRRENMFYLTSVRSEGQFNSIIYHEYDTYREQQERWVVLMNPQDMAQYGWRTDQKVDLVTSTGRMSGVKVKPFDIRRGNLMTYYPEANILIGNQVDPHSKTPGFKSVPVNVETPCA
jgi:molybdopterin-dependent oxidoreductase alpha subunit